MPFCLVLSDIALMTMSFELCAQYCDVLCARFSACQPLSRSSSDCLCLQFEPFESFNPRSPSPQQATSSHCFCERRHTVMCVCVRVRACV